jgi:hypothetical protein
VVGWGLYETIQAETAKEAAEKRHGGPLFEDGGRPCARVRDRKNPGGLAKIFYERR